MKLSLNYTVGAGAAALYVRQRDFDGKFANFATLAWDVAESADTKAFLSEPAPGFFSVDFNPIAGAGWSLEVIEAATGAIRFEGETEAAPLTLAEIRAAIIEDHGAGLYGPGVAAEYAVRVTVVVAGSVPAIPIPDVTVTLLNADETVTLDQRRTDSLGKAVFPANAGNYVLRHRKAGYSFPDDTAEIVAADVVHICEGAAYVAPLQQIPGMQMLRIVAKEFGRDAWAVGDIVKVTMFTSQQSNDVLIKPRLIEARIGSDGIAEITGVDDIPLDIGVRVKVTVGTYLNCEFVVDATPFRNIMEYLV